MMNKDMVDNSIPVDTYQNVDPAVAAAEQLPDELMLTEYVDHVIETAISPEDRAYLEQVLEADPQLSQIFDTVVETASEFSGGGHVTGPGSGISDSIPARLSDGEFVMTKKAVDQLGPENLQVMMDDAERAYDGGQIKAGMTEEDNVKNEMLRSNRMPSLT